MYLVLVFGPVAASDSPARAESCSDRIIAMDRRAEALLSPIACLTLTTAELHAAIGV